MRSTIYLLIASFYFQISFAQLYIGDRCTGREGRRGVCQLISNCSSALMDVRKKVAITNCGFQGKEPIVCCLAAETQPSLRSKIPAETAKNWCREYKKACPPEFMYVGGGDPARADEFPHMAAVGYGEDTGIKWECGGSLISDKFVLTAAHCLSSRESGPAKWVLLGTVALINTTSTNDSKGQIHPITRRIPHPEYKPPAKYNDIALLEIGSAVTPNPRPLNSKGLHPACLSTYREFTRWKAVATGWGRMGFGNHGMLLILKCQLDGNEGSSNLLKVKLDIFDVSVCQDAYNLEIKSTSILRRGIEPTMLCAGVLEGKRDTCEGDSGGPLQYPLDNNCMYEIWGVTSFGKVCTFPNSPSVYTKVLEYIPWIEDIVWPA